MKEARLFCCLSLPSLLLCPAPSCYFIFLAALPFLLYLPATSLVLLPYPPRYLTFPALPPRYLTRPVTVPSPLPYLSCFTSPLPHSSCYRTLPATLPFVSYPLLLYLTFPALPPRYLTRPVTVPFPLPYLSCFTSPLPSRYLTLPATYPFHYLILPTTSPFLLPYPPYYLTLLAASVSPLHETATQCPGGWRLCGGLCAAVDWHCPWIQ